MKEVAFCIVTFYRQRWWCTEDAWFIQNWLSRTVPQRKWVVQHFYKPLLWLCCEWTETGCSCSVWSPKSRRWKLHGYTSTSTNLQGKLWSFCQDSQKFSKPQDVHQSRQCPSQCHWSTFTTQWKKAISRSRAKLLFPCHYQGGIVLWVCGREWIRKTCVGDSIGISSHVSLLQRARGAKVQSSLQKWLGAQSLQCRYIVIIMQMHHSDIDTSLGKYAWRGIFWKL